MQMRQVGIIFGLLSVATPTMAAVAVVHDPAKDFQSKPVPVLENLFRVIAEKENALPLACRGYYLRTPADTRRRQTCE